MIVVHCIYFVVRIINTVPTQSSISEQISSSEMATGQKMGTEKYLRAQFGAYIEASRDTVIANNIPNRMNPCISLGPLDNIQVSVKCLIF